MLLRAGHRLASPRGTRTRGRRPSSPPSPKLCGAGSRPRNSTDYASTSSASLPLPNKHSEPKAPPSPDCDVVGAARTRPPLRRMNDSPVHGQIHLLQPRRLTRGRPASGAGRGRPTSGRILPAGEQPGDATFRRWFQRVPLVPSCAYREKLRCHLGADDSAIAGQVAPRNRHHDSVLVERPFSKRFRELPVISGKPDSIVILKGHWTA